MKNFLFNDIVTQQKIRKLVRKIIYELLDIDKENALSTEYLKQALGFRNVRSLRKQVERERLNGKIIISSSDGGYYKPSNSLEVKEFVRNLENTANSMIKIAELAKVYCEREVDNAEL